MFWKSAGSAPSLRVLTWHLPYNLSKSTEKTSVRTRKNISQSTEKPQSGHVNTSVRARKNLSEHGKISVRARKKPQ